MICPKCGEKYNFYEPQCPWCGAPKSVDEQKPTEDISPKDESQEKEDECITFDSKREHEGRFEILRDYFCSLFGICLGLYLFRVDDMFFLVVSLLFLIWSLYVIIYMHYSLKFVRKVICYKDRFVLCSCFDERAFSFDKANRPEKKFSVLGGGNTMVFRNSQYRETFIVCEFDFPEVVDAMKKVYGISAE